MIPLRRHLQGRGRRGALIAAGGVAAAILAVGGYVMWSGSSWSSLHTSYDDWRYEAKSGLDHALRMPADTARQREAKLKALTDEGSTLTADAASRCQPNGLVGWQASINATYKKWQQECEANVKSISKLNEQLVAASAYLKSEHALAGVLSSALVATNGKVTEKSFSAVLSKWKAASSSIKGLEAPAQFGPVKAKAQKSVDSVVAAWQALVKAHAAKNETDYNAALKAMDNAYSYIEGIGSASTDAFATLVAQVQKTHDAAF